MTSQEIIEKAIQKAIDGGWQPRGEKIDRGMVLLYKDPMLIDLVTVNGGGTSSFTWSLNDIIFNHDFAKALWNYYTDPITKEQYHVKPAGFPTYAWQYHLQQMVIADNPIKYLGENI